MRKHRCKTEWIEEWQPVVWSNTHTTEEYVPISRTGWNLRYYAGIEIRNKVKVHYHPKTGKVIRKSQGQRIGHQLSHMCEALICGYALPGRDILQFPLSQRVVLVTTFDQDIHSGVSIKEIQFGRVNRVRMVLPDRGTPIPDILTSLRHNVESYLQRHEAGILDAIEGNA